MSKKWIWGILILSLAGIVLGGISAKHALDIEKFGLLEPSFCTLSTFINCDVVQSSSYSQLLGVPIGWWGLLYYLWNGVMAASLFWAADKTAVIAKALCINWLGLAYSAAMAFV